MGNKVSYDNKTNVLLKEGEEALKIMKVDREGDRYE